MQRDIETKRQEVEREKQRADLLSKIIVEAESRIAETNSKAQALQTMADATLYQSQKEAQAKQALYEVQSKGLRDLVESFGGNSQALLQFMMLEKNLYPELAKANADAIKGLQPKIHIWNTGPDTGKSSWTSGISDLFKTIPPLTSAIQEQTGIQVPDWIAKSLPTNSSGSAYDHRS